jgi:hypothetical protein
VYLFWDRITLLSFWERRENLKKCSEKLGGKRASRSSIINNAIEFFVENYGRNHDLFDSIITLKERDFFLIDVLDFRPFYFVRQSWIRIMWILQYIWMTTTLGSHTQWQYLLQSPTFYVWFNILTLITLVFTFFFYIFYSVSVHLLFKISLNFNFASTPTNQIHFYSFVTSLSFQLNFTSFFVSIRLLKALSFNQT